MAYRFKTRSTTPGQYRLAANTLSQLIALGDIQESVGRGDGGIGTFAVPPEAKVNSDTSYGAGGTEFTGTLNMALYTLISGVVAAADVRNGTARYSGGGNGTCYVPAAGDVQEGVNVDATTGTFVVPLVTQVVGGVSYGAGGTEFTGTYSGGGGYTYGDNSPQHVLTSAAGAGNYHAPDAAEVISTAVFGPNSGTAGTYDVANVSAGNIKTGVSIGGVSGTFTHTADYVAITDVVSAAWVVTGHDNYTGGSAGTYPTTATSQAAQLATDQAEVLAAAASIKDDATILGQAGTYNYTAAIAAGHAAGHADQLAIDVAAVTAAAGSIFETATILGVAGTLTASAIAAATWAYADRTLTE